MKRIDEIWTRSLTVIYIYIYKEVNQAELNIHVLRTSLAITTWMHTYRLDVPIEENIFITTSMRNTTEYHRTVPRILHSIKPSKDTMGITPDRFWLW